MCVSRLVLNTGKHHPEVTSAGYGELYDLCGADPVFVEAVQQRIALEHERASTRALAARENPIWEYSFPNFKMKTDKKPPLWLLRKVGMHCCECGAGAKCPECGAGCRFVRIPLWAAKASLGVGTTKSPGGQLLRAAVCPELRRPLGSQNGTPSALTANDCATAYKLLKAAADHRVRTNPADASSLLHFDWRAEPTWFLETRCACAPPQAGCH
jgi:hypothetical protein